MRRFFIIALLVVAVPLPSFAASVSFATSPLWLSATRVAEGQSVIISTAIMKAGPESITGNVAFYANEKSVGSSDFSLGERSRGAVVSISWVPAPGEYKISAKITSATAAGNTTEVSFSGDGLVGDTLVVLPDTDRDGIADVDDPDDDNDGTSDAVERAAGTDPLLKSTAPQVAGVSTSTMSDVFEDAASLARSLGSSLFEKSEALRAKGGAYVEQKLEAAAATSTATSTAEFGYWWGGFKIYALKALSFLLNNIYAFYIALILLTLWVIRRVWRRYSLD